MKLYVNNLPNKLKIFIIYLIGISFLPGYPVSFLLKRIFTVNAHALIAYSSFTVYVILFLFIAYLGRTYYFKELIHLRRQLFLFIFLAITGLVVSYVLPDLTGLVDKLIKFTPRNSENQNLLDIAFKQAPVLITVMAVLFGPFVEETVFRGIILNILSKKTGLILAVLLSSLLFGLIHVLPAAINDHDYTELILGLPYFSIGLVLGTEYALSKNIYVSMATHMLYNLVSTLIILNYFFK